MKVFLTSLDTQGGLDFAFTHPFGKFIQQVPIEQADYIFLILMNRVGWTLDEEACKAVMGSPLPKVVFDYWETSWDVAAPGIPPPLMAPQMEMFHWKAYFKRHCVQGNQYGFHPIDFYNFLEWPTIHSFEEFQARPIDVFLSYGLSHPLRPAVHAALMASCHEMGWTFITKPEHMLHEEPPYVVLLHTPYYDRLEMDDIMLLQSQSKITISLPGAGTKCFRHSESPINSVMAFPLDDVVWQAGWGQNNSIQIRGDASEWPEKLKRHLNHGRKLYDRYLAGTKRVSVQGSEGFRSIG